MVGKFLHYSKVATTIWCHLLQHSVHHNGTHASDLLGNEAIVRQLAYDVGKMYGNKDSRVDFGLEHWGLKQKPNESYIQYVKRVQNSKLWKSKDSGLHDLTRDGATDLNRKHH